MNPASHRFLLAVYLIVLASTRAQESVRLAILSSETGATIPCRIHLQDAGNKPVQAPGLPFWRDHFVCTGEVSFKLPLGAYSYQIERGPEHSAVTGSFTVAKDQPLSITNRLARLGVHRRCA